MTRGKVLILDDSEIVIEATQLTLEDAGYTVVALTSPFELLETIHREKPDILLVDVNMPALQGPAVVEISKGFGALEGVPVLFYSTLEAEELQALVERYGADGYVHKTLDKGVLQVQVEQWVTRSRARRGL